MYLSAQVENSRILYIHTSSNSDLTVDFTNQFVYVPAGAVVGAYIPDISDKLPLVGFVLQTNPYGLCLSANNATTSQDTTVSCSTTSWPNYYYRLHLKASIGKLYKKYSSDISML